MIQTLEKVKPEFRSLSIPSLIWEEKEARDNTFMKLGRMSHLHRTMVETAREIESERVGVCLDVQALVDAADEILLARDMSNVDDFLNGKFYRLKQAVEKVRGR